MFFFEIRLKRNKKVRWDDVTIVEEGSGDDVFFTESNSPSESVMGGRSVHLSRHLGCRWGGEQQAISHPSIRNKFGSFRRSSTGHYGTFGGTYTALGGSLPTSAPTGGGSSSRRYPLTSHGHLHHHQARRLTPNLQEEVEAASSAFRACSFH